MLDELRSELIRGSLSAIDWCMGVRGSARWLGDEWDGGSKKLGLLPKLPSSNSEKCYFECFRVREQKVLPHLDAEM